MKDREAKPQVDEISARFGAPSKAKLEELLAFAQTYRHWSHRELAAFLARDVHNLVPGSGIPKVDLVLRLAKALDWPAAEVFDEVCGERPVHREHLAAGTENYGDLNRAAYAAFTGGRFDEMVAMAVRMHAIADCAEQRAEACLREYGGWDGLGRYEAAIEAIRRGLEETDAPLALRLRLAVNLASAHHLLGRHLEGEGIATALLERLHRMSPTATEPLTDVRAMAMYVRGQCRRSGAIAEPTERGVLAVLAREDLSVAAQLLMDYARAVGVDAYASIADISRGALLVLDVLLDSVDPETALAAILAELDRIPEPVRGQVGYGIESLGWWCVYGAELAIGYTEGDRRDHLLAIFTEKGHELAAAGNNWALRERILTFEYIRRCARFGVRSLGADATLDREDLTILAGAMGRFPRFRPLGWELVRAAMKVD